MCKGKPDLAPSFIAWLSVSVSTGKNPHQWTGASSVGLWEEIRVFQVYRWQEVRSCSQVQREGSVDAFPSYLVTGGLALIWIWFRLGCCNEIQKAGDTGAWELAHLSVSLSSVQARRA